MIGVRIEFEDLSKDAIEAAEKARRRAERKQAYQIIRMARDLMPFRSGSAQRNAPPHSHTGKLRSSLSYAIEEGKPTIVGPRKSIVGERGFVLEFAGTYDVNAARDEKGRFLVGHSVKSAAPGTRWAHPFMKPAFDRSLDSLPGEWAGAIGNT